MEATEQIKITTQEKLWFYQNAGAKTNRFNGITSLFRAHHFKKAKALKNNLA